MLDPFQLKVFITAAETLNFSRAAEKLHLSQPSVTQHIRSLENRFGSELFVRSGNRLSLSESGQALLPIARQIIAVSLRADEVMEALKGEVQGNLIIGCSTTPGKYILPLLLSKFMRQYPRVQASCHVTGRDQALQMLSEGRVHLALSSDASAFDKNVDFVKLMRDPITLIAPLSHPWADRTAISIEEIKNERLILREPGAGTYQVVRSALARNGINIEDLRITLTLGNSEAIAIAVKEGVGIGFVSQTVVTNMVAGQVKEVPIAGVEIYQDIYIGRNRLNPAPRVQTAFWEFINNPENTILNP